MENEAITQAARLIKEGGLVAFPTETVYGLGANALDNEACLKIFKAKGRPANNPLIVHVLAQEQAEELAHFNEDAYKLSILWPGPLTMVLPIKSPLLARCVTAGLDTVAIRVPIHPLARKLLLQSAVPIAAPSANKSGRLSPTTELHVKTNFADEGVFILEEKNDVEIKYGIESTIVDLSTSTPTILRFGFITPEVIREMLGKKVEISTESSKLKAPGMMYLHYAPQTLVRINAQCLREGEIGLGFGKNDLSLLSSFSLNLSPSANLAQGASNLFAYLHLLDTYAIKNGARGIAVAPIPNHGIGLAINDRLTRAAARRIED